MFPPNLATDTTLNAKINETKNEIPGINNLAATAALTTIENKVLNVIDLVIKVDYDVKISEMENKYFTATDYDKSASNTLDNTIAFYQWLWFKWKDKNISKKRENKNINNKHRMKSRAR